MAKKLLSVKQMAEFLNVSLSVLYGLIRNNSIPYFRVGKSIRFDSDVINTWLQGGGSASTEKQKKERVLNELENLN